jgi:FMN phosphatase YigB (HAD superfamily)
VTSILTIFDFDDTLIKSHGTRVRVRHADGTGSEMTSAEYARYEKQPGDVFDYSDFEEYPHDAAPIQETFQALQRALAAGHDVMVLTARGRWQPVRRYLEDHGFGSITVYAVGNSNPMAKARAVIDLVRRFDYELVEVYEDNLHNIRAIKKVVTDQGVSFRSVKVSASGRHVALEAGRRHRARLT